MATRAHTVPKFYLRGFAAPESETQAEPFVWVGTIASGEIVKRSPKNISILPGFYDGPGGFPDRTYLIEDHLSKIESDAATAIRKFAATPPLGGNDPSPAIWRFLAWQAARTFGWLEVVEESISEWNPNESYELVEPPPDGMAEASEAARSYCFEDHATGARHEAQTPSEFADFKSRGWKWVLRADDKLELMHVQAWYFQVRHFPRLKWTRLNTPAGDWFITSDRAVTWSARDSVNVAPAELRHKSAQLVAPLTRRTALVGRNIADQWSVTPREVNRFIACTASKWVAGPTHATVRQALDDRIALLPH